MILLTVECSKLGLNRALRFDLGLSGVTPGNRVGLEFRRVSVPARGRRTAHARADSLEHSTVASDAQSVLGGRAGKIDPRWRFCNRTSREPSDPDFGQEVALA